MLIGSATSPRVKVKLDILLIPHPGYLHIS